MFPFSLLAVSIALCLVTAVVERLINRLKSAMAANKRVLFVRQNNRGEDEEQNLEKVKDREKGNGKKTGREIEVLSEDGEEGNVQ